MPETYGLPEPEPTPPERVQQAIEQAVAGKSVVRAVLLYAAVAILAISPVAPLAIVPLVLLMATDSDLSS